MAITVRSHRADRGSIPRIGAFFFSSRFLLLKGPNPHLLVLQCNFEPTSPSNGRCFLFCTSHRTYFSVASASA